MVNIQCQKVCAPYQKAHVTFRFIRLLTDKGKSEQHQLTTHQVSGYCFFTSTRRTACALQIRTEGPNILSPWSERLPRRGTLSLLSIYCWASVAGPTINRQQAERPVFAGLNGRCGYWFSIRQICRSFPPERGCTLTIHTHCNSRVFSIADIFAIALGEC